MGKSLPLVSIIVTSYNYAKYIGKTIQSVLDQTYQNWELIISDDCSTDNSLEIIKRFKEPRIKLITNSKNQGAYEAYTRAYELSTGKYFVSLDSDDYMHPERIEKQVNFLEKNPKVDILGTYISEIDEEGKGKKGNSEFENWFNVEIDLNDPKSWVWGNRLCHSSVMIRTEIHKKVGNFNKELIYSPDYEFWLRNIKSKSTFKVLANKLTYYRSHKLNITNTNPEVKFYEVLYINRNYVIEALNQKDLSLVIVGLVNHPLYKNLTTVKKGKILSAFLAALKYTNINQFNEKIMEKKSNRSFEWLAATFDFYKDNLGWHIEQLLAHKNLLNQKEKTIEKLISQNSQTRKTLFNRIVDKVKKTL